MTLEEWELENRERLMKMLMTSTVGNLYLTCISFAEEAWKVASKNHIDVVIKVEE